MKVAADEVVHVIAVRHRLVTAAGAVRVPCLVVAAGVPRSAIVRIRGPGVEPVRLDAAGAVVVELAVVEVVHVIAVPDCSVAAAGTVVVVVVLERHRLAPPSVAEDSIFAYFSRNSASTRA